jgi:hypothetical protein
MWGNLRDRDALENLGIDGEMILKWFFLCGLDLIQLRAGKDGLL